MAAAMEFGERQIAVRVRNLSATGAQIESVTVPPVGTPVRLRRGELTANGSVVRSAPGQCGLRFDNIIDVAIWLPTRPGARDQAEVDRAVAEARGGVTPSASRNEVSDANALRELLPARVAEELALVARTLSNIGDALSGDPLTCARYSAKLQDIDTAEKVLNHLATLLTAAQPDQAIARIGMESLRRRLERKTL